MKIWAKWMPKPLRNNSYSYEAVDRRTKTEMEVGGIYRPEFDTDEGKVTCQIVCNSIQASFFEKFERDALHQGSAWFTFPLWLSGKLVDSVVRFSERPKLSRAVPPYSFYTLTLEVQKRGDIMCDQTLDALEHFGPDELIKIAMKLNAIFTEQLSGSTIVKNLRSKSHV